MRVIGAIGEDLHVAVDRCRRHGPRAGEFLGGIGNAVGRAPAHIHTRRDRHCVVAGVRHHKADDRGVFTRRGDIGDADLQPVRLHRAGGDPVIAQRPMQARQPMPRPINGNERRHQRRVANPRHLDQPAIMHRYDVEILDRPVSGANGGQRDPVIARGDHIIGAQRDRHIARGLRAGMGGPGMGGGGAGGGGRARQRHHQGCHQGGPQADLICHGVFFSPNFG